MIYLLLALLGNFFIVLADFLTKNAAVSHLKDNPPVNIINGIVRLNYAANQGAAWGMFQGGRWFFVSITIPVIAAIYYYYIKLPKTKLHNILRAALVMISGGALGNFIDRLRQGYVVDFIDFHVISFPIFNVADIFVVCGTILFAVMVLFFIKDEKKADE